MLILSGNILTWVATFSPGWQHSHMGVNIPNGVETFSPGWKKFPTGKHSHLVGIISTWLRNHVITITRHHHTLYTDTTHFIQTPHTLYITTHFIQTPHTLYRYHIFYTDTTLYADTTLYTVSTLYADTTQCLQTPHFIQTPHALYRHHTLYADTTLYSHTLIIYTRHIYVPRVFTQGENIYNEMEMFPPR